ncbi:T9SS type A sorting domain-containing protein [Flavobacterium sp. F372]|uniref:T9SS type A sorting domain-containing protein n=1 Tax=Flavobacterium bernardetii TaxID=2813823 RepID=A0ABR7IYI9_9FLAO|nr:T9SS type A sorting domain-containing protein [Flavobacterium bernardetii]MBC5834841.1 T9SS type A sorting domain-containing protein [Flavobacterium bernardetii]NHF70606.1 T9SS type A sorting domain-containing protein [Flavobacterium bernardetii]
MKKLYFLAFLSSIISFGQTQIGSDINGEAIDDYSGDSVSLSNDGSVIAIGATQNDGNGSQSGHVRIYKNVLGVWTQIGSDINGEASVDISGSSVSLSSDGSIVAIGAYGNDGNGGYSGHVRIFKNILGVWSQLGSDINGEAAGDYSGYSVSLSSDGSVVAIGAYGNDGNGSQSGHVRIFKNVLGAWTQIGSDINGETVTELSGTSVSLSSDGNVLAIGAPYNDGSSTDPGFDSGKVRIYKNISGVWTKIGSDIDGDSSLDYSGKSISLSNDGNIIAIGTFFDDNVNIVNCGAVRIYKNISDVWTLIGLPIYGDAEMDKFGDAVSLSGDGNIVAIGAPQNDGNGADLGHVRIFKNISDVWTQVGIDIDGESEGDKSGSSVSLSSDGNTVAIGARYNDGNGTDSGHVRVYDLSAFLNSDSFVLDNFSIYPNPTSEFININLENNLTLEKVNIYNTLGQIIKSEKNKTIDVKSLAKGNYFVEVITNQGKATKTIIVE